MRSSRLLALLLFACGTPQQAAVKQTLVPPTRDPESTVTTVSEETRPDPFEPTSGPGDVPVQFVHVERSSRLDRALPLGAAHEVWSSPLGGTRREVGQGAYLVAAGNRVAVAGAGQWASFDLKGRRVGSGQADGPIRIDRVGGAIGPDETRSADLTADAKVAIEHGRGLSVMVKGGGIYLGERVIEGKFEALDVAIDDLGVACVVVRQNTDLALWSLPLGSTGSIGRQRVSPARRVLGPPILGKTLRILVLDTGLLAVGLDGKRLWERRGVPTGGVTVTADDEVLVSDEDRVLLVDRKGRPMEIFVTHDVVFVTPPILTASGLLVVASGALLHAVAFS